MDITKLQAVNAVRNVNESTVMDLSVVDVGNVIATRAVYKSVLQGGLTRSRWNRMTRRQKWEIMQECLRSVSLRLPVRAEVVRLLKRERSLYKKRCMHYLAIAKLSMRRASRYRLGLLRRDVEIARLQSDNKRFASNNTGLRAMINGSRVYTHHDVMCYVNMMPRNYLHVGLHEKYTQTDEEMVDDSLVSQDFSCQVNLSMDFMSLLDNDDDLGDVLALLNDEDY